MSVPALHPRTIVELKPWRCPACGAMLAKLALTPGSIVQIKCGRCNAMAIKEAA